MLQDDHNDDNGNNLESHECNDDDEDDINGNVCNTFRYQRIICIQSKQFDFHLKKKETKLN